MQNSVNTLQLAKNIRLHTLKMVSEGQSSHIGSILSMVDIISVLYGYKLNVKSKEPLWEGRDRFILSKGHAGAGVYAALAELGFFPTEELLNHYKNGSIFSGHVSHKGVPGVEFSTGSLGHGLGVASGMALAAKIDKKNHGIYVVLSDGECDEGSNWEAILFSSHHRLHNLTAIIDYNKIQSIKSIEDTLGLEPFKEKWVSFGWEVFEVDGHNHEELIEALDQKTSNLKPKCILAHTVKGKWVSFMENNVLWHYRSPQGKELTSAIAEIENA